MHLEEITAQAEKDDSVAGLMRFLLAKFPAVVNKLVPPGLSDEELRQLLDEDPDYFNDLCYDEVVQGMANVLLVSSKLYPYKKAVGQPEGARDKH